MNTTALTTLLTELRLPGMRDALLAQEQRLDDQALGFHDRFYELLQAEQLTRHNHGLATRLRQARLHHCVAIDTLHFAPARQLSKTVCLELAKCQWVKQPQNILISGATGTGKTYLACALAHQACVHHYSCRYYRLPRLLQALQFAEHSGTLPKLLQTLSKADVIILDDWGLSPLADQQRRHLLEVLDDRYHRRPTIITSQLPIKHWHEYIGEATLADAILDRLVHNAQRFELQGESLRAKKGLVETRADIGQLDK